MRAPVLLGFELDDTDPAAAISAAAEGAAPARASVCAIRFGLPLDLCGSQYAGAIATRVFSVQFSLEFG